MIKNTKLNKLWDSLHSSYWFVPALMMVGAIALAFLMLTLDRLSEPAFTSYLIWIYSGGPDGARSLLLAIAGSMITVAGTVFSITIVALQLASSQFGPRIMRNFMQDTGNQVVLGTFIATFIYCLLVLRTVRGEPAFVPKIAVTVAILLAIINTGVLIYFIHHAATSIQASHIIKQVTDDLDAAIERLFPHALGHALAAASPHRVGEIPIDFDPKSAVIKSGKSGYLQTIDAENLLEIATHHQLLVRLNHHPGNFIVQGSELVRVYPGERVDQELVDQVNDIFILGRERTERQDVAFPINQLVEIACRAISPGINDPFTAIRCIDRLSVGLSSLAEREFPSPYRYDDHNNLRIIATPYTFADLTNDAFNQIRQYGSSDVAVVIRLLSAIQVIVTHTHREQDRAVLLRHATMIKRNSQEGVLEECDRTDIEARYQAVLQALEAQRKSHDQN